MALQNPAASGELTTAFPAAPRLRSAYVWCGGLLIAEYLSISLRFDATYLVQRAPWFSGIGYAGPLFIAMGAAVLLLPGKEPRSHPGRTAWEAESPAWIRWTFLVVHLVLFVFFFELTRRLAFPQNLLPGDQRPWVILWAFMGVSCTLALILAAPAARRALAAFRRTWSVLLIPVSVGTAAWVAGRAAEKLWTGLSSLTLAGVAGVLHLASSQVVHRPERVIVGLKNFQVRVAPECSGYEGIGLIVVFTGAVLFARRKDLRFPIAFLLVPIGVVAAWSANVLRIAGLILVGSHWSIDMAYGGFHSKAGWVLFCGVSLGLAALARRRPFAAIAPAPDTDATWVNPATAYVMPLVLTGIATLGGGLLTSKFPLLDPLRFLAAFASLWIWRQQGNSQVQFSRSAVLFGALAFAPWLLPPSTATVASGEEMRAGIAALGMARGPWLLTRILGMVVMTPVIEELAFRGFLFRRLMTPDFEQVPARAFNLKAFVLSSLASGVIHQAFLASTIAGMVFALAQVRRGRPGDAIAAHIVANALLTAGALATGRWDWWAGMG